MAQTNGYGFELDKAQAGQKYDVRPDVVQTFLAEAEVAPGTPLMRGTDPERQAVVSDASGFVGVALFTHAMEQPAFGSGASYQAGDAMSVLTDGAAWVVSSVNTVVAGETAYVTAAGAYTNVESTNLAIGTFLTGGDENDLVVVELS